MAFFDYTKPGRGISKDEPKKEGIALYLDILFKRFGKLVYLNLLYIVASIPAIVIGWFISNYFVSVLAAFSKVNIQDSTMGLLCIFITIILLLVFGSGPATAALTYVLRKYASDTHAWVWTDFKDGFKNNFKQGIAAYFINIILLCIMFFSYVFYTYIMSTPVYEGFRILLVIFGIVFSIMQMFVYHLMAGYKLTIKYIYKNAFFLMLIGIYPSDFSIVVTLLIVYATYMAIITIPPLGILFLCLMLFSIITFSQIFITNNLLTKYILKPANQENTDYEK